MRPLGDQNAEHPGLFGPGALTNNDDPFPAKGTNQSDSAKNVDQFFGGVNLRIPLWPNR
jgi:hypothetical protein